MLVDDYIFITQYIGDFHNPLYIVGILIKQAVCLETAKGF